MICASKGRNTKRGGDSTQRLLALSAVRAIHRRIDEIPVKMD